MKPVDWDTKYRWEFVEEANGRDRMRKALKYIRPGGVHLDIGTGRGDGTCLVAEKKRTIGVDYGIQSLRIAKLKNQCLFQADGRHLPFQDGVFSSVTLLDVIEHVPGPEILLAEAHRVLGQEGILVLQTPTVESSRWKAMAARVYNSSKTVRSIDRVIKRLRPSVKAPNAILGYQPYDEALGRNQLKELVVNAGFEIRKWTVVTYFCPILLIQLFCYADLLICEKKG
ncbi:MAG: hypothetical protein Kow0099_15120 [Candidatus Abyssubacteria bacterium]